MHPWLRLWYRVSDPIIIVHQFPLRKHICFITDVFISLNGEMIPDHGYVVISDIGSTDSAALLCHTNRAPPVYGNDNSGGNWFAPDGTRVYSDNVLGFRKNRDPMVVRLLRTIALPNEGIYQCAVEDDTLTLQTLYMGLFYTEGGLFTYFVFCISYIYVYMCLLGNISLPADIAFTLDSDHNQGEVRFTLTCISTGGPVTSVTWTRDSITITEGTETVLDDPVTAQYTHTLSVTRRLGGLYTCTVANNKPSIATTSINIEGERH